MAGCGAGRAALAVAAGLAAPAPPVTAQELKFPPGGGPFLRQSYADFDAAVSLEGQRLTIFGPWRGEDQVLFEAVLAYFAAATGVEVAYSSSESYEQQIVIDTRAGSPPDIAILAQPGLIADLAAQGLVTPLGDETAGWLRENHAAGESWVALGTSAGPDGVPALHAFP